MCGLLKGDWDSKGSVKTLKPIIKTFFFSDPETPSEITSTVKMSSKNIYNIDVTWKKPEISPDYYLVEISDRNMKMEENDVKVVVQNVTGIKTGVYFSDVEINGIFYEIIVKAFSKKGSSFDEVFLEINQSLLDSGKL